MNKINYWVFKYLWILVLLPKSLQLLFLSILLIILLFKNKVNLIQNNSISFLLLTVSLIYFFSIVLNTITGVHDTERVLAAINSWIIFIESIIYLNIYLQLRLNKSIMNYYLFIDSVFLCIVYFIFLLLGEKGNFPFMPHSLAVIDWLENDATYRFAGYMEYSNLVIFYIFYVYRGSIEYLSKFKFKKIYQTFYAFMMLLVAQSTHSRSGIILIYILTIISLIAIWKRSISKFYMRYRYIIWPFILLFVLFGGVILYPKILYQYQVILNMRAGSNNMRNYIYEYSIQKMLSSSPIIGCGIKDSMPNSFYPMGSHSTYIGMFFKIGLIGGTLFLIAVINIIIKVIKLRASTKYLAIGKGAILAILLLCIVEDLDGANWNIVLFMVLVGYILNRYDVDYKEY